MWNNRSKSEKRYIETTICQKNKVPKSLKNTTVIHKKNDIILDIELWVIVDGLNIVRKKIYQTKNIPITNFSNLLKMLTKILKVNLYISTLYLRSLIYQKTSNFI